MNLFRTYSYYQKKKIKTKIERNNKNKEKKNLQGKQKKARKQALNEKKEKH